MENGKNICMKSGKSEAAIELIDRRKNIDLERVESSRDLWKLDNLGKCMNFYFGFRNSCLLTAFLNFKQIK